MNCLTTSEEDEAYLRWGTGGLLIAWCLAGFTLAVASVVVAPSLVVLSGCLSTYLQVFGSAMLLFGVMLLPSGVMHGVQLRGCALIFTFLSPFATWDFLGQGNVFIAINSMLWQAFGLQCVRLLLRSCVSEYQKRQMRGMALRFQLLYWVFLILVFAPYCARFMDLLVIHFSLQTTSLHADDLWNTSLSLLDFALKYVAMSVMMLVTLASFMAWHHLSRRGSSADFRQGQPQEIMKEQEKDGDHINGGVGCVQ